MAKIVTRFGSVDDAVRYFFGVLQGIPVDPKKLQDLSRNSFFRIYGTAVDYNNTGVVISDRANEVQTPDDTKLTPIAKHFVKDSKAELLSKDTTSLYVDGDSPPHIISVGYLSMPMSPLLPLQFLVYLPKGSKVSRRTYGFVDFPNSQVLNQILHSGRRDSITKSRAGGLLENATVIGYVPKMEDSPFAQYTEIKKMLDMALEVR